MSDIADPIAATFLQGLEFHKQGRLDEAEARYRAVLAKQETHFDSLHFTGLILWQRGRAEEAVEWIGRAIALNPSVPDAHSNLGLALQALKKNEEALASYDRALALRPVYPEALNNRGNALQELHRLPEAVASYDRALQFNPTFSLAHGNRGNALRALGQPAEALECYDRALQIWPDYADALNNRVQVLHDLGRYDEAIATAERLMVVKPDQPYAPGLLLAARLYCCDWADFTSHREAVAAGVARGERVDMPLTNLWHTPSPAIQQQCARIFSAAEYPPMDAPAPALVRPPRERIRLAYLSHDFFQHTVAMLVAELFELHDRSLFEVSGVSYGPDDGSEMRERLQAGFDRFVDVRAASDSEVADQIRGLGADIVVDLTGFTTGYRAKILAQRPAPIQVNYLGFPGTLGTLYHDYILADRHVIPERLDRFYSEKVVRLPDTYMVNDRKRRIAQETPSRAAAGLPESGFVFCSFNNAFKIQPDLFDVWMRLLQGVPQSVLWLLENNPSAAANLRSEAERRGVDAARLVFAPRVSVEAHIARHRLADLFLDTYPYTSHTAGNDALWAGLPLLALTGEAFASRVSGSLLKAAGLPELITGSLADYEVLAMSLANAPTRLAELRQRLEQQRATAPLFDTPRFCRHIEAAFRTMYERWQAGAAPVSFDVPAETP
jgi:protein O-GlcNAc transferase